MKDLEKLIELWNLCESFIAEPRDAQDFLFVTPFLEAIEKLVKDEA